MAMKLGKRHMQIALVVMLATLAWNAYRFYWSSGPTPIGGEQAPLLATVGPVARPTPPATRDVDPAAIPAPPSIDVRTAPVWVRDPFLAPGESRDQTVVAEAPEPVRPDPVVRSILYSSERRVALVDRRLVRVGDVIEAGTITDIQPDAIVLRTPGGDLRRVALARRAPGAPAVQGASRSK